MLFNEVYGSYFNAVASILAEACDGTLTAGKMDAIVREKAFAESALSIPASLMSGEWPLLDSDYHSVIRHSPTMPLTNLERRWLKSLISDPRIALFSPSVAGLEDVEPLYPADVFVKFDQYADGDPFEDSTYIACFHKVLQAIQEQRKLRVRFHGRTGAGYSKECFPFRLEYSAKDDKFRVLTKENKRFTTINMARIHSCEILEEHFSGVTELPRKSSKELTLLLHDERNALERVLLHFSHFEKETRKLNDEAYQIRLRYDQDDETEMLIRVLSFGPVLEVKTPLAFVELMRERISKQLGLMP